MAINVRTFGMYLPKSSIDEIQMKNSCEIGNF